MSLFSLSIRHAFLVIGALASLSVLQTPLSAQETSVLPHTAYKLGHDKELTIGYLGGSLTAGSGAKRANIDSWRAKTTQWFKDTFPDAKITEVNAAIGGTGSDFGVFRVDNDLLSGDPDLVFVEFAVNDNAAGKSTGRDKVTPAMEGIVRRVWEHNPNADIVFVYTTMKSTDEYNARGELTPAAKRHQTVADYYGIPTINIGQALWEYKDKSGKEWTDITIDNVHPNDEGYAVYSKAMLDFMESVDWDVTSVDAVVLPDPLFDDLPMQGTLVAAAPYANGDWTVVERNIGKWDSHLFCETPGKELRFKFKGDAIGLLWISQEDAGAIEFSVDGQPFKKRDSWSKYGKKGRLYGPMFYSQLWGNQLEYGEHEMVIKVAPESNEESLGSSVRIVAFMINGEPISAE